MEKIAFETPRLFALQLDLERDLANCFLLNSNAAVMRFIRPPADNPEPIRERLSMFGPFCERCPDLGLFMLFFKENGQFVGNCIGRHTDFDVENGDLELGYAFLPEFWGIGLASETVAKLAEYLFEKSNAPRLVAFTDPENLPSENVLLKNGFLKIGSRELPEGTSHVFEMKRPWVKN